MIENGIIFVAIANSTSTESNTTDATIETNSTLLAVNITTLSNTTDKRRITTTNVLWTTTEQEGVL